MNFMTVLNYGVPTLIIVIFVVYFVYQIFFKDKMLRADVRKNIYGKNLNNEFYDTDQFICSECGLHLQDWEKIIGDGEIEEFEFKFCPNCGADMRGKT